MSKRKEFLDDESSFRGQYSRGVFETLLFAYRPVLPLITLLSVLGLLGRLLLLANANLVGLWVDSFCKAANAQAQCRPLPSWAADFSSQNFLLLLIVTTIAGFALSIVFRVGFSRNSAASISRLYDEVTLRTSRQPMQFFDQNPTGRVVTRFSSDYGNIFRLFGGPLADLLSIVFDLIGMFILLGVANRYFILIFVASALINFFIWRFNVERLRIARRDLSASRSPSIALFAETTQGASTIRSYARQSIFVERFRKLNGKYLFERKRAALVASRFSVQMSASTAALLFFTGVFGVYFTQRGLISVGSIGVAFTFIVMAGTSLQMFFEWLSQFEEAMTSVERLDEYLRRPIEPGARLPASRAFPTLHPAYQPEEEAAVAEGRLTLSRSAAVTFEDVWLRYGPELPMVLKGLNFSIRPGEKVGIIGRTGSGKTSLVQALFYLYPLHQGRVLIDGVRPNLEAKANSLVDLQVYRRAIALISQEPTLFRGTIRDNLDLTRIYSEQEMLDALKRVGLGDWLTEQSGGLDATVEERGRNLSLGERQLLCMARCLLQNAPVVVMDEATSAVDPQSEEIMVRATREFFYDRTQLIIAHRLSTLAHCDRILWLDRGEMRMFDRPQRVIPAFRAARLVGDDGSLSRDPFSESSAVTVTPKLTEKALQLGIDLARK